MKISKYVWPIGRFAKSIKLNVHVYVLLSSRLRNVIVWHIFSAVDTTDVPLVTYSVTFTVSVTDIDDVAPVFVNLPSNATVYRSEKTGD